MPDEAFIRGLPKTELHMHLEGSMEPETMFEMARRNGIALRWASPEALRAAYEFDGLPAFLDLYFEACAVLRTERDFHDVIEAYLRRARQDGVIHAEIFFGPQTFLDRDIPLAAMMEGILGALDEAAGADFSAGLLVSVHRHRSEAAALDLLRLIEPWADRVLGIGMGGAELGNPPAKFVNFFKACRAAGFRTTVHAGEEGPPTYVRDAVDLLQVSRIDHGVAAAADPAPVAELARRGIPLTVCPLSNLRLKVVESLAAHPLKGLLDAGVCVTVNSDDPPYFGGWVTENLVACQAALGLSRDDIVRLVRNGFAASFMPESERTRALGRVDAYVRRPEC
jgi:adenosine deaminase